MLWLVQKSGAWAFDAPLRSYVLMDQHSQRVNGPQGERQYLRVRMADTGGNELAFTVSLPQDLDVQNPQFRLPVLLLFTGFRSAERNLERVPSHGENAVISYDYPYDPTQWRTGSIFDRFAISWRVAHQVPDQIAATVHWVRAQGWADSERLSLAGVSLGAVFLPAVQRRIQSVGTPPTYSIMAYGGVDIAKLARANLKLKPVWFNDIAATAIGLMLRRFEPTTHLPHLRGEFLIINGEADERIPATSRQTLERITPSPKTIIHLPGAHIDGKRDDLIAATNELVRLWLVNKRALNP